VTLNPAQKQAVDHHEGPLLVMAGPGSGKTRVVTHRTAKLIERGISPSRIMLVTFTKKAAGEMRGRLKKLVGGDGAKAIWCGTFHALSARMLRSFEDDRLRQGRGRDFIIYGPSDGESVVKLIASELELEKEDYKPADMREFISRCKSAALSPDDVDISDERGERGERMRDIWLGYEAALKRANAFDFDDLLLVVMRLAESDTAVGRGMRNRFSHVLVDEYQDTNVVQFRLTRAFAEGSGNICVVGDHRQSIYGFRGADHRNILAFGQNFPGATVVDLDENYRSSPQIVACFNAIIDGSAMRTPNAGFELVDIRSCADQEREADKVASDILAKIRRRGVPPTELAVLYRVHALSRAIEDRLRNAGVPYQIVGGTSFYDRAEVRNILSYLRLVDNPQSDVDFTRVVNVPPRRIGAKILGRVSRLAEGGQLWAAAERLLLDASFKGAGRDGLQRFVLALRQAKRAHDELRALGPGQDADGRDRSLAAVTRQLIDASGYRAYLEKKLREYEGQKRAPAADKISAKIRNIEEVASAVAAYEARVKEPTLAGFLEEVSLLSDQDKLVDGKVSLMTIHASKGLEFDAVWLIGAEKGFLPSARATTESEIEEEDRLAFVACSRARKWLSITYCDRRLVYGEERDRWPSPFLERLPVEASMWLERDRRLEAEAHAAPRALGPTSTVAALKDLASRGGRS